MKKTTQIIIFSVMLVVMFSVSVNAFAVTLPYMKDKTMVLYPGESTEFTIGLQNMVGDSDQTVMINLEEGGNIARIIDKENVYKVPKGANNVVSRLKIEIPPDTPLGTEYRVRFTAGEAVEATGGMVQIATGLSDYFIVSVGPVPEVKPVVEVKSAFNMWWIVGVAMLIVVIFFVFIMFRKRKKE